MKPIQFPQKFLATVITYKVKSSLLTDEDIHKLWEILGRIADDPNNSVNPSEDAEVFIGYYDD